MLTFIIRGVFVVGVIGWWSTSLWKMIDSMFKVQFQRYLEEEYRRYPYMRKDMETYGDEKALDKAQISTDEALQQLLNSSGLGEDAGNGSEVRAIQPGREDESMPADAFDAPTSTGAAGAKAESGEKEVGRPMDAGEPTYRDTSWVDGDAKPPDERKQQQLPEIEIINTEDLEVADQQEVDLWEPSQEFQNLPQESTDDLLLSKRSEEKSEEKTYEKLEVQYEKQIEKQHHRQQQSLKERQARKQQTQKAAYRKKQKSKRIPVIGAKSQLAASTRAKQTLTVGKRRRFTSDDDNEYNDDNDDDEDDEDDDERYYDRDFSEFDDEYEQTAEGELESKSSVAVADLPYRPVISIYDLDRLSAEEFCPFTLDDDDAASCEETRTWP